MGRKLWTQEEVLDRIRLLHKSKYDLSQSAVLKTAPKLVSAATRYFGSWRRAVEAAGIDYASATQRTRRLALAKRSKWSKERIIECIRRAAELKEPLQASVVSRTRPDLYGAAKSPRYFGGWKKALEAAGIKCERGSPFKPCHHAAALARWKAELLLEKFCQLAEHRFPLDERDVQAVAPILYGLLLQRFGSWTEVLRAVEGLRDGQSGQRRERRKDEP